MQPLPVVAICGRPNVGKSSLFNMLAGKRISIVDPTPGVTRDRISTFLQIQGKHYELVDTGGIGLEKETDFGEAVFHQVQLAIDQAQLILFLVDIQEGVTPLDIRVAELLRECRNTKTIWIVANKADEMMHLKEAGQFFKLGFGEPICISAAHNRGIEDLQDKIIQHLPPTQPYQEPQIKIAVVGRTNVGKSTFINALAEEERVIVSEIPGTTRDSVDVYIEKDGKTLIVIDTAGIKRHKNVKDSIEFYSQARSQKAIHRADVVIFMMDAAEEISNIDKQIAAMIRQECKPAIIVVNKWDLAKGYADTEQYEHYISSNLPELTYAPLSFITAKTGKNVPATIGLAQNLGKEAQKRVSTGELNREIMRIVTKKAPPVVCGKQGKIYYATQTEAVPPTFLLFVNYANTFDERYQRYLFHELQRRMGFKEIPIKLVFRERSKQHFMGHVKEKEKER